MATTYMALTLPTPSVSTGPGWASTLNTALTTVDSHDHTSGHGVPVPISGININSDVSLAGFNLTNAHALRLSSLSGTPTAATDINELVDSGGNLFWMNSSGQAVQITAGAALSATSLGGISGLPSGTASAAFGSQTFTWRSATNTAATMDGGPVLIRDTALGALAITLASPVGVGGAYTLTLPASLPVSSGLLSLGSNGVLSAFGTVSGGGLTISGTLTMSTSGSAQVIASGANSSLFLIGNRTAADSGADVVLYSSQTRVAGLVVQVRTNGVGIMDVDYQGLVRLSSQTAPLQPASMLATITPAGGWGASTAMGYWKDATGVVHVKGSAAWHTLASAVVQLPVGFRPASQRGFVGYNRVRAGFVALSVSAAGNITLDAGSVVDGDEIYFDPISFLAEQ